MTEKELKKQAFINVLEKHMSKGLPTEAANKEFAEKQDKLVKQEMERLRKEQNKEKGDA